MILCSDLKSGMLLELDIDERGEDEPAVLVVSLEDADQIRWENRVYNSDDESLIVNVRVLNITTGLIQDIDEYVVYSAQHREWIFSRLTPVATTT